MVTGEKIEDPKDHPPKHTSPESTDLRYFAVEKKGVVIRKVFVSLKVKRFSDIDNVRETFRVRFHLYLDWLISWNDYQSYLKAHKTKLLKRWEPKFKPKIEFVNAVNTHTKQLAEYGHLGVYRVLHYKDWLEDTCPNVDLAYFQRVRWECDLTLSEQMELHNFPLGI